MKPRNYTMSKIIKNDPRRVESRTNPGEKAKRARSRARSKSTSAVEENDCTHDYKITGLGECSNCGADMNALEFDNDLLDQSHEA